MVGIAVLGITILWLLEWRRAPEEAAPAPPAPAPSPPPEAPPPERPPVELRALAIEGRVAAALGPVAGVRVVLGETGEEAVSGESGDFRFAPSAERPGRLVVLILRGDTELAAWDDVVSGDLPSTAPAARAGETSSGAAEPPPAGGMIPARPERIRWSVMLAEPAPDEPPAPSGRARDAWREDEWLRLEETLAEEWGNGARVRVRGRSRLPDGVELSSSLYFDGLRFLSTDENAVVEEGAFTAQIFSPPDLRLYSGPYSLRAAYNLVLQPPEVVDTLSGPAAGLQASDAEVQVFIGRPQEAREEDLLVEKYYSRVLLEAAALEGMLRRRVEEIESLAKGWSPEILASRALAREGWFHEDMVAPGGEFREEAWRRFLDEEWRPALSALLEAHRARGEEKYRQAGDHMERVLRALHELSLIDSAFVVYPLFHLPQHPNDFYLDVAGRADRSERERTIRQSTEALERYRRLVPDRPVPGAARE